MIISSPPSYTASQFMINRLKDEERSLFIRLLIISGKYEHITINPKKITIFWPTNRQLKEYLKTKGISLYDVSHKVSVANNVVDNYIFPYSLDAKWFGQCKNLISEIFAKDSHTYNFNSDNQELLFDDVDSRLAYVVPVGRMVSSDAVPCKDKLNEHEWLYIYDLYP